MNKIVLPYREIALLLSIFITFTLSACGSKTKEYYKDGSIKSIGETSQSKGKQGNWQFFYNNGAMMSEGEYVNNKPDGKWTYWNSENIIVAEKNFRDGVEISEAEKEAAPKAMKEHTSDPETTLKHTPEPAPKPEHDAKHETSAKPETAATHEIKTTEPHIENTSGFASTMEEWKARKEQTPEVEAHVEIPTEKAKAEETLIEPVQESSPVAEEKVEILEPVQAAPIKTAPVQEVEAQPIEEEPAKKQAPAQKKKPATSGGKFWLN